MNFSMSLPKIPENAQEFSVELSLAGVVKCKTMTIPEIKVFQDKVPSGTKKDTSLINDL